MSITLPLAALGAKALLLLFIWLASAIISAELSRSKGYGERPGLGTGLLLSFLGPIIWLIVPPKDELAEWHTRKPWQRRRKPRESEMAAAMAGGESDATASSPVKAGEPTAAAGSRSGEGSTQAGGSGDKLGG